MNFIDVINAFITLIHFITVQCYRIIELQRVLIGEYSRTYEYTTLDTEQHIHNYADHFLYTNLNTFCTITSTVYIHTYTQNIDNLLHIDTHTYIYVYVYIYIHIHICIYIYTQTIHIDKYK